MLCNWISSINCKICASEVTVWPGYIFLDLDLEHSVLVHNGDTSQQIQAKRREVKARNK